MKLLHKSLALLCAVGATLPTAAQTDAQPEEVVFQTGSIELVSTANNPVALDVVTKAKEGEKPGFTVPKFAIKSRNNSFVMSIGGSLSTIMGYDIGNNLYETAGVDFTTSEIPVPAQKGKKGDYFINPFVAALDFTVAAFAGTENQITGYVKIGTNGNNHNIILKKAWVKWRGFLVGMHHSLFTDSQALQPPTIDQEGPCGDVVTTSYQIRWQSPYYNGFSFAASLEMPSYMSSNGVYRGKDFPQYYGDLVSTDAQEFVPNIPMWIEYKASSQNRVRFSAILRDFAYRDLVKDKVRNTLGWGVMLSGVFSFYKPLTFNYQAAYGRGIATYIQDIAGSQISFTPKDNRPGEMEATKMMGLVLGASYQVSPKWQINAVGSYARTWGVSPYAQIGDNGDIAGPNNYHNAWYLAANVFYNITPYLQWGLEYDFGRRTTYALGSADDSRIQTMLQFSF